MIRHYSCGAAFKTKILFTEPRGKKKNPKKSKLQSIRRTSYSWILNRSATDHCNNSRTQELTSFFSPTHTEWGYFTFAVPHIHYRNMSCSYSTPLRQYKTYRDHVLLRCHELDSIHFSTLTWRYHHLPSSQKECLLPVLVSGTLQLRSLARLVCLSASKRGLKCNKQISHFSTWCIWSV